VGWLGAIKYIFGEQDLATVLGLKKQIIANVFEEQVALFHNAVIEK
jgi:hypothetical protein